MEHQSCAVVLTIIHKFKLKFNFLEIYTVVGTPIDAP